MGPDRTWSERLVIVRSARRIGRPRTWYWGRSIFLFTRLPTRTGPCRGGQVRRRRAKCGPMRPKSRGPDSIRQPARPGDGSRVIRVDATRSAAAPLNSGSGCCGRSLRRGCPARAHRSGCRRRRRRGACRRRRCRRESRCHHHRRGRPAPAHRSGCRCPRRRGACRRRAPHQQVVAIAAVDREEDRVGREVRGKHLVVAAQRVDREPVLAR